MVHREQKSSKKMPPWLVGLIIAIIVFVLLMVAARLLGYGDDPSIGLIALPIS